MINHALFVELASGSCIYQFVHRYVEITHSLIYTTYINEGLAHYETFHAKLAREV